MSLCGWNEFCLYLSAIMPFLAGNFYKGPVMKKRIINVLKNDLFLFLINGVIAYTALTAVIIATLNVPPEAILETNLPIILDIFEG